MNIVLSGGGTAGHVNPALAVAEVLTSEGHKVYYAGTPQGVEARLVQEEGYEFRAFVATGFNRNHPLTLIKAVNNMFKSTKRACKWLTDIKADCVICFGGYVCLPIGRAASSLHIPVIVHEQNSVMGIANKDLAKRAQTVCLTYGQTKSSMPACSDVRVTGNPVRKSIFKADATAGRELFNIPNDAILMLVTGGSLGARHLNESLIALKKELLDKENLYIVHVCGPKEVESVESLLNLKSEEAKRWITLGYTDRMGDLMAACDFILSRAGASTLAEVAAVGIPALLIPFPYATGDHQTTNAQSLVSSGAAFMVKDEQLDTLEFKTKLFELIEDDSLREQMRAAMAAMGSRDAAGKVVQAIYDAIQS